jgi:hypothetical protein
MSLFCSPLCSIPYRNRNILFHHTCFRCELVPRLTNELRLLACPKICLSQGSIITMKDKAKTYAGREIKAKRNGASDTALPSSVGSENHVKIWATVELEFFVLLSWSVKNTRISYAP